MNGPPPARRWAWLAVLAGGAALYLAALDRLTATQDPAFVPAMVLLAGTVVPATFVAYAVPRPGGWRVRGWVLALAAFSGALVGTAFAVAVDYETVRQLAPAELGAVALVEEAAKLIAPAAAIGVLGSRHATAGPRRLTGDAHRAAADGLVVGLAIGAGFAALETMAYTFATLLAAQGDVGEVSQVLFARGLLAPAAHAAWTGLAGGALWRLADDPGLATGARFAGTFVAVVAFHGLWDGLRSLAGYVAIGAVSAGWLLWQLRRAPQSAP